MLDQSLLEALLSPAYLGLIGLCVGSFLNVVIYRTPVMLHRTWLSDCADQLAQEDDLRTHAGLDEAKARQLAASVVPLREALDGQPAFSLIRPPPVARIAVTPCAGTRTCRCWAGCVWAGSAPPARRRSRRGIPSSNC